MVLFEKVQEYPALLNLNKTSIANAEKFGRQIIATVEANGMNPETDKICNDYLVKLKTTYTTLQDRRKPITQLLDELKKQFTEIEQVIDPKRPESIYARVQGFRDAYAKDVAEAERKRQEEAQKELNIKNEKAEVRSTIDIAISGYIASQVEKGITAMRQMFNDSTLKTIDMTVDNLKKAKFSIDLTHTKINIQAKYIDNNQVMEIAKEAYSQADTQVIDACFKLEEERDIIVMSVDGRKAELKEYEKADTDKRAELDKQAKIREAQETIRRNEEAEALRTKAIQDAEASRIASTTANLFDAAELNATTEKPTAREGFEIKVTHPAGYVLIFQTWFEQEGSTLAMDAIEKKSISQMKSFCEKYAHKTGSMIKSPYIKYEPKFKAIAKAS